MTTFALALTAGVILLAMLLLTYFLFKFIKLSEEKSQLNSELLVENTCLKLENDHLKFRQSLLEKELTSTDDE